MIAVLLRPLRLLPSWGIVPATHLLSTVLPEHFAVAKDRAIMTRVTVLLAFVLSDHAVVTILIGLIQLNKNCAVKVRSFLAFVQKVLVNFTDI
jgi:hypothetical protein